MLRITLAEDICGKHLFRLINTCIIPDYSASVGVRAGMTDFCRVAGISRQQMHLYRKGHKPADRGFRKIVSGLKAWGYEVTTIREGESYAERL